MAEMPTGVLLWMGRREAAGGICLSFQIGHILRIITISLATSTTDRHLGFEHDYHYDTAFRACSVYLIFQIRATPGQMETKVYFNLRLFAFGQALTCRVLDQYSYYDFHS